MAVKVSYVANPIECQVFVDGESHKKLVESFQRAFKLEDGYLQHMTIICKDSNYRFQLQEIYPNTVFSLDAVLYRGDKEIGELKLTKNAANFIIGDLEEGELFASVIMDILGEN